MVPCMVSFRGHEAPAWVLEGIANGTIGAVCLFNYNIGSLQQLRRLNLSLMRAAEEGGQPPPIIGIDQEGGQLMAVSHGATELPGNMALGASGSEELARLTGELLGRELLALGCNMNFAPVLDLATQPSSDVMGVRVFGEGPELAGRLGAALVAGMQGVGVLATAKHFPGHGDTAEDSHHAAPVIRASRALLSERELEPFRAAFRAGVAAVMTCHAVYPALDPHDLATHSRAVLHDLLRADLGYEGLVITDALDMSALGDMPGLERARRAVMAGADLALLGHLEGQREIVADLARLVDPRSEARVMALRRNLPTSLPPLEVVGSDEHRAVARATAEAAVTAVRGDPRLRTLQRVLLIGVEAGDLTPAETAGGRDQLATQLEGRVADVTELRLRRGAKAAELDAILAAAEAWLGAASGAGDGMAGTEAQSRVAGSHLTGEVVVATVGAASDPAQLGLLRRLCDVGADPLLVALRGPLDVAAAAFVNRALCSYGRRPVQTEAVARVLCGEAEAPGRLPVRLPAPGAPGSDPAWTPGATGVRA